MTPIQTGRRVKSRAAMGISSSLWYSALGGAHGTGLALGVLLSCLDALRVRKGYYATSTARVNDFESHCGCKVRISTFC